MASTASSASAPTRPRVRRAPDPARRRLLLGSALVALGSFMPWLQTSLGSLSGSRGPGLWTFYLAMLGFAGVMLPVALRKLAGAQAALLGIGAVGLPVWQLVHTLNLVGFAGWMPGPGIVLVLGGGVLAAVAARPLLTRPAPEHA